MVGLRPPYQPLPDDVDPTKAPARLLLPDRGIVPFTGRTSQLRELQQWSRGGGLRVLTGAGGAGKTRLPASCAPGWPATASTSASPTRTSPPGRRPSTTTGPPWSSSTTPTCRCRCSPSC